MNVDGDLQLKTISIKEISLCWETAWLILKTQRSKYWSAIPKKYWHWHCQYFFKVLLTTLKNQSFGNPLTLFVSQIRDICIHTSFIHSFVTSYGIRYLSSWLRTSACLFKTNFIRWQLLLAEHHQVEGSDRNDRRWRWWTLMTNALPETYVKEFAFINYNADEWLRDNWWITSNGCVYAMGAARENLGDQVSAHYRSKRLSTVIKSFLPIITLDGARSHSRLRDASVVWSATEWYQRQRVLYTFQIINGAVRPEQDASWYACLQTRTC